MQELRAELQDNKKDKGHQKRLTTLKKIVATMTMGQVSGKEPRIRDVGERRVTMESAVSQDMSPLFPDVVACMPIQVLQVKKLVYLYLINYARSKPDMAQHALEGFLNVSRLASPTLQTQGELNTWDHNAGL